jgi:hypothetical protein
MPAGLPDDCARAGIPQSKNATLPAITDHRGASGAPGVTSQAFRRLKQTPATTARRRRVLPDGFGEERSASPLGACQRVTGVV